MSENDFYELFDAIKGDVVERGYDPYNHYGKHVPVAPKSQFLFYKSENKSVIAFGGLDVYLQRRWNWFHRATMRIVFGWKVLNL